MPKLNVDWSKGFFRVWLVITILWVAITISVDIHRIFDSYAALHAPLPPTPPEGMSPETYQQTYHAGYFDSLIPPENIMQQRKDKLWNNVQSLVAETFLPPLVLLVLWYIFRWILNGFKKTG